MAHGGKRKRSGRTRLEFTDQCLWVVERVRLVADSESIRSRRITEHVNARYRKFADEQQTLGAAYVELKRATVAKRREMIKDEVATPLEEARQVLAEPQFPRFLSLRPPGKQLMGVIYDQVAQDASLHFGRTISRRQVADCCRAWVRFQSLFPRASEADDLENP